MKIHPLDILVPFGPYLQQVENKSFLSHWKRLILNVIPFTFFLYWLHSLIPYFGTLFYTFVLIPLSAKRHIEITKKTTKGEKAEIYLWYFTVITIGFGGLWSFIGHTVLADSVAQQIGWATGSPFQTELAFYTLGSSFAGLLAIWLKKQMIMATIITKSVFLYGAGYVHIMEAVLYNNYSPLNIGAPLIGDIVLPTIYLVLLWIAIKDRKLL